MTSPSKPPRWTTAFVAFLFIMVLVWIMFIVTYVVIH
jgi:hypothetical protein